MVFRQRKRDLSDEAVTKCCLSATNHVCNGLKRGVVCMQQNDSCIILQAFEASKLGNEWQICILLSQALARITYHF